jgi:hypothetical protein
MPCVLYYRQIDCPLPSVNIPVYFVDCILAVAEAWKARISDLRPSPSKHYVLGNLGHVVTAEVNMSPVRLLFFRQSG